MGRTIELGVRRAAPEEDPMVSPTPSRVFRTVLAVVLAAASLAVVGEVRAQDVGLGSSPALDQLKRGYTAMGEGAHEAALEHYRRALERATTTELRFQANLGIGSAAAALGRFEDAHLALETALEIKPTSSEALLALGELAKARQRWEEAASFFAEAAVNDPELVEALTQLGVVYAHQGRHRDAAEVCERAVAELPEDEEAQLCLGVARYHLGQYAEASRWFAAVVERNPGNARARYGLGLAQLFLEDRDGAEASLAELEKLDPVLARDLEARLDPKQ
jgi:tetratricopeptide (TPR) repeat protein